MLEMLFRSRARVRILRRLLLATRREFYQRELAILDDLQVNAVKRELPRLLRAGLVLSRVRAGRKYFRINPAHGLYPELKALFLKVSVLGKYVRRMQDVTKKIDLAFIFGSFATGEEDERSDLDLVVVTKERFRDVDELWDLGEVEVGTEFNPMHYSPEEFRRKRTDKDG
jgi:DNA-binding transcriptional ArsR family regulator